MRSLAEDCDDFLNLSSLLPPPIPPISFDLHDPISTSSLLKTGLQSSLASLKSSSTIYLATLLILTLSIFVFLVGFYGYLYTAQKLAALKSGAPVRIYLNDNILESEAHSLKAQLKQDKQVLDVVSKTKTAALNEFKQRLPEVANLLSGLEEYNPLPASLEVILKPKDQTVANYKNLVEQYQTAQGVEAVRYDKVLVSFLNISFEKLTYIGFPVLALTIFTVLAVIWGSFYLLLLQKSQEIKILKLLGATKLYIKTPYLITAAALCITASIVALFATKLLFSAFNGFYEVNNLLMQSAVHVAKKDLSFWSNLTLITEEYLIVVLVVSLITLLITNICIERFLRRG